MALPVGPGGGRVAFSMAIVSRVGARAAVGAAGLAAVLLGVLVALDIAANTEAAGQRLELTAFAVLGGWSFVLAGAVAHLRERGNRTGRLMVAVGLAWLVAQLNWTPGSSLVLSASLLVGWLWAALLAHLMLAFPSGRLESRSAVTLAVAAYVVALPVRSAWTLLSDEQVFFARWDRPPGCTCPGSLLSTGLAPGLAGGLRDVDEVAVTVIGLLVCGALLARWHAGTPV